MEQQHFVKIFWFCCGTVLFVFIYMLLVTFVPVPPQNKEHVNNILPFLEGTVLGGAFGFLVGGAVSAYKGKGPSAGTPGTANVDISATVTPAAPRQPK